PPPRLRARSMLSLGTELFLAFWIASYSVGLAVGSLPPVRAETSMFLISLANILPRFASIAAFLCLVVAHFEWPDILCTPSEVPVRPTGHAVRSTTALTPDSISPFTAVRRTVGATDRHTVCGGPPPAPPRSAIRRRAARGA